MGVREIITLVYYKYQVKMQYFLHIITNYHLDK
jgi:hypothetical protein